LLTISDAKSQKILKGKKAPDIPVCHLYIIINVQYEVELANGIEEHGEILWSNCQSKAIR
jgi:hypothetical protein